MSDTWGQQSEHEEAPVSVSTEDVQAATAILSEAPVDNPVVQVIGVLNGAKLVKATWNGQTTTLSDRTISALQKIGITVEDKKDNYVF